MSEWDREWDIVRQTVRYWVNRECDVSEREKWVWERSRNRWVCVWEKEKQVSVREREGETNECVCVRERNKWMINWKRKKCVSESEKQVREWEGESSEWLIESEKEMNLAFLCENISFIISVFYYFLWKPIDKSIFLPRTIRNVILMVLIFAFGITPLELVALEWDLVEAASAQDPRRKMFFLSNNYVLDVSIRV